MKRRGFLGMLLGVPAAPVAAALLSKFPKGIESEPEILHGKTEILGTSEWKPMEDYSDEDMCSYIAAPVNFDEIARNMRETRERLAADVLTRRTRRLR